MRVQSLCKWPDDKLAELGNEYNNGLSFGQLAKKHNCSIATISNSIKRIGIKTRMITHNINNDYFEFLDSADKCYWFGFLAADGYAKKKEKNHKQYHLIINLKATDIRHLHKFRDAIGATHPIKTRSRAGPFGYFSHAKFEISCKKNGGRST